MQVSYANTLKTHVDIVHNFTWPFYSTNHRLGEHGDSWACGQNVQHQVRDDLQHFVTILYNRTAVCYVLRPRILTTIVPLKIIV